MILPIKKELIPYQFETEFNGILYTFEIHYNSLSDFFTVDLLVNENVIAYGEKIVYGQRLFKSLNDDTLPHLIPLDPSGKEDKVTYKNLSKTVFLEVIDDAV